MKVHSFAYEKFYLIIYKKFRLTELSEDQRRAYNSKTPEIWDLKRDRKEIFEELFGSICSNSRIFYRKRGDIRKAEGEYGEINDDIFIAGLNYINIHLPEKLVETYFIEEDLTAKILYQLFLEQEFPAFLKAHPEFKFYDKISNILIEVTDEIKVDNEETTVHSSRQDYSGMDYNIIKAVNDFYHFISVSKIDKAWGKLTANFQRRAWKEKFESFAIGYTNTIAINNVHVWDVHTEEDTAECKVYYLEKAAASTSVQLGHLDKLSLRELDEFIKRMKEIMEKAADTELVDFEKIEIQKFFEPTVSEYIWYKCGMKPDSVGKLLPNETVTTVPRLYSVSLAKCDDDWLLTGITPIKYQLHR